MGGKIVRRGSPVDACPAEDVNFLDIPIQWELDGPVVLREVAEWTE